MVEFFGPDRAGAPPRAQVDCTKANAVSSDVTEQISMVPIYKVQTTTDLAYDATAYDVKTALEALTQTCKVDVQRSVF